MGNVFYEGLIIGQFSPVVLPNISFKEGLHFPNSNEKFLV